MTKKIFKILGSLILIICLAFTVTWGASFALKLQYSLQHGLAPVIKHGLSQDIRAYPFDIIHYTKSGYFPSNKIKLSWWFSVLAHAFIFGLPAYVLLNKKQSLYGDARFANAKEIREAKLYLPKPSSSNKTLFAGNKIIVGQDRGQYIALGGQQFVYLSAPTRSGKGVGVVIPVGLSYEHSLVVSDIKQELFNITAWFRIKNGHEVHLFNPFAEDGRTARWNPLSYVRREEHFRFGDINEIAISLIPDSGGDDVFFEESARKLFNGLVLYLLDIEQSIPNKEKLSTDEKEQYNPTIRKVLDLATNFEGEAVPYFYNLMEHKNISQLARQTINSAISSGEKTFASILTTLTTALSLWFSPIVSAATSGDDFDLREVRKKKMSIYIGILPKDLIQASKIINLFYSQLINLNTAELPQDNKALKYQCLLLMDEATAAGKIKVLEKAISYMAGYNMRLLMIVQSPAQLRDKHLYGEEGTKNILTNIALKILFKPSTVDDSEEYSKLLGKVTVYHDTQKSRGGENKGVSRTETQNQRDLMMPQELRQMSNDKEIIIYEGISYPIWADKNFYYKDPVFKARYENQEQLYIPQIDIQQFNNSKSLTSDDSKKQTPSETEAKDQITITKNESETTAQFSPESQQFKLDILKRLGEKIGQEFVSSETGF